MATFLISNSSVRHMESDLRINGFILFIDGYSLRTADGRNAYVVAGSPNKKGFSNGKSLSAKFDYMEYFCQLDRRLVVIADHHNNCLRLVDRQTETVSTYAGKCGRDGGGSADGESTAARFAHPLALLKDRRTYAKIFVSDENGIRVVDTTTQTVTTMYSANDYKYDIFGMAWENDGLETLLLGGDVVTRLNVNTLSFKIVAGNEQRNTQHAVDGRLSEAQFMSVNKIIPFTADVFIVPSPLAYRLRVIDLKKGEVSSICKGVFGFRIGGISGCELQDPNAVLLKQDGLYVGGLRRIVRFPGNFIPCKVLKRFSILLYYLSYRCVFTYTA